MRLLISVMLACIITLPARARVMDQQPAGLTVVDWSQIRAEYERHRHTAFPVGAGFNARTRELQWNTRFDGRGFEIRPDDGTWHFGLELLHQTEARVTVKKNSVTYTWSPTLEEWFVNEAQGLEHGFTIHKKDGPIILRLKIRGVLRASGRGTALRLVDSSGATILMYSQLRAWDSLGRALPSTMESHGGIIQLSVDDRGAIYPVTIDPLVQQAFLKPVSIGTTQTNRDVFGRAVAVSGNTVVVGAEFEDSSSLGVNSIPNENAPDAGAAYVFVRAAGVWRQQAYLRPAAVGTDQNLDRFGHAVSISGDTVVVGAPNEDSGTLGVNSTPNESIRDSGAAYVFVRTAGVWSQQAYLKPASAAMSKRFDGFGTSVAVSGETIAVGAPDGEASAINPLDNPIGVGSAYVFVRVATAWSQQGYLRPEAVGTSEVGDLFGNSIAVSGDTVLVGADREDSASRGVNSTPNENAKWAGAAYVFVRTGGVWSQQAYLKPAAVGTNQAGDFFGASVALSGDTAVVGACREDSASLGVNSIPNENAADAGAAYVFVRTAGAWKQEAYLKPAAVGTTQAGDCFGFSVSVWGDTVAVGATGEASSSLGVNSIQNENSFAAGAAYVFVRKSGTWTQQFNLKPTAVGTTQAFDIFGTSVALSDEILVVGAEGEDSSSVSANSTPDENGPDSGAAYVFVRSGPAITEVIDAGSLRPEIAASAWVTIKGSGLAPSTRIWLDSDFVQDRLPTSLDGVSVTIDGKPAAVYFISPVQINVLAGTLTRTGPVNVILTTPEGIATFTATVKERAPAWFMLDPETRRYVAAVNSDGKIVGKVGLYPSAPNFTKPLPARGRALIYGTGWGATNPPTPEGIVFSGAYSVAGAAIKIGGVNVVIEFAGVVTPGLYQFNLIAPNLPPGDYLIEGTIGGVSTQAGAYITLGPSQ